MREVRIIHPFLTKMTIQKCISISREFEQLAEDNKISWSEAARVGMAMMLADLGLKEYDNNLNLFRKMNFFKTEMEKLMEKIENVQV